jgi:hypothetical protein
MRDILYFVILVFLLSPFFIDEEFEKESHKGLIVVQKNRIPTILNGLSLYNSNDNSITHIFAYEIFYNRYDVGDTVGVSKTIKNKFYLISDE